MYIGGIVTLRANASAKNTLDDYLMVEYAQLQEHFQSSANTDMAWFLFRISPNSMGDDGIMSKGTRYTDEFKAKAVRLLTESRPSYSSETKAIAEVARDLGVSSETLRRWRNQSDASAAEQSEQSAQEAMAELKRLRAENAELRRANEILTTASAFFAARLDPTRP